MTERLIGANRSLIIAADIESPKLPELVEKTSIIEGVGGYKIGIALALEKGLPKTVETIKERTNLPVIYDHQKAGNDIPQMGEKFAKACSSSGVDAVIIFPFVGEKSERAWINACQENDLSVLVGAHMTHEMFLLSDGGSIEDSAPTNIFSIAASEGVRDFVLPGNKPEYMQEYMNLLEKIIGDNNFNLYAPGFIDQGGKISDLLKISPNNIHPIVGGAIYNAEDISSTTKKIVAQMK